MATFDDDVPMPPAIGRARRMATLPVDWNGETVRVAYHPITVPPRERAPRDPRDEHDNPNVHVYLRCALCHRTTKHTSYHPVVQVIETPRGLIRLGGFVCPTCHAHLTSAPRDEFGRPRIKAPRKVVFDDNIPIPPEEVSQ